MNYLKSKPDKTQQLVMRIFKNIFFALLIVWTFTTGYPNLVDAKPSIQADELLMARYEGFVDLGRIVMNIAASGLVEVNYTHHPMVVSKTKPWKKRANIEPKKLQQLFTLLQTDEVKNFKCPELTLMPGQDVTMSSIDASVGKKPPFLHCTYIEPPKKLSPVIAEIKKIYALIKQK
jgi:hypothetical protein